MEKTIIVTLIIDEFPLEDMTKFLQSIENLTKDYEFKRTDVNMSDTQMVKPLQQK